jgi:hypothetical protein
MPKQPNGTSGPLPLGPRFWSKVDKSGGDDACWLWAGKNLVQGYGRLDGPISGKKMLAHRLAWTLTHGAIPDGLCVLHRCDTPLCVNPAHLWLGTRAENNADCNNKGRRNQAHGDACASRKYRDRMPRGEQVNLAKLTTENIHEIRALAAAGTSSPKIAKAYSVDRSTIRNVLNGRTWFHVPQRAPDGARSPAMTQPALPLPEAPPRVLEPARATQPLLLTPPPGRREWQPLLLGPAPAPKPAPKPCALCGGAGYFTGPCGGTCPRCKRTGREPA